MMIHDQSGPDPDDDDVEGAADTEASDSDGNESPEPGDEPAQKGKIKERSVDGGHRRG